MERTGLYTCNSVSGEETTKMSKWIKKEEGFTLIELMITMMIFVLILASTSDVFTNMLREFKQQSKIAETNIEGAVSLEMLRRDIESAGYGVPWNVDTDGDGDGDDWTSLTAFCEAVSDGSITPNPTTFNDGATPVDLVCDTELGVRAPKALNVGNGTGFGNTGANNGADYLVIRAVNVANNTIAGKWTHLKSDKSKTSWNPASENLSSADRIIVISPGSTDTNSRSLIVFNNAYSTTYNSTDNFAPSDSSEIRIIYGIGSTAPRAPFNRADYFIKRPATNMPSMCANDSDMGILYKATLNHDGGGLNEIPLLDCVADMQVVFGMDNDEDGDFVAGTGSPVDAYADELPGLTAKQIRDRVKEIRVYILAQEGQKDTGYTYPTSTIPVGLYKTYDLTRITDWRNYRWKIYTIIVKANNLK